MKSFFVLFIVIFGHINPSLAQRTYWQQHVDYHMDIDMDVDSHQYRGKQVLKYTNNSPDTLQRVFYHLYFNAFQPGSMMDVRSLNIEDPSAKIQDRISKLSPDEIGFIEVNSLTQDNSPVSYQTEGTVLVVDLQQPILPGTTTTFSMDFVAQVPIQVRRSGRDNAEGVSYSMSQWYPKMAEYDYRGWHPTPYIGREFHGVWGDFEVMIHIDKNFTLGGTGYLQNPEEVGHGYSDHKPKAKKGKLTWHFKAPMVHDFMWAADDNFKHITHQTPDGPELHFLYIPDSATRHWEQLPEYTAKAFEFMNQNYGRYPYKQYSVIQGGDGGMEYPMGTLITGHRSLNSLVGVTVHEMVHSWYQGVLANNESLFGWMDEGFTEFAGEEVVEHLFNKNTQPHPHLPFYNSYINLVRSGREEPLTTHADHFNLNTAYVISAYSKGAVFLGQLAYIVGEENFRSGMKRYFNQWKFRHPEPNDLKRVMEKQSGMILSWYFEQMIGTTKTIDYRVKSVQPNAQQTGIELERIGDMIMPIDVKITLVSGATKEYQIPLQVMRNHKPLGQMSLATDWAWTNPTYELVVDTPVDQIETVEIDPNQQMADINRENNLYKVSKKDRQGG